MTTQLEPTGIRRIDILIQKGRYRANIVGQTVAGKNWIIQNMGSDRFSDQISVDNEFIPDIVEYIEKDGLTVLER